MPKIKAIKTPEECVAEITVNKDVIPSILYPSIIKAGTRVSIARIIRSPAGLSFRIKNTRHWLQESDVIWVHPESNIVFDYIKTIKSAPELKKDINVEKKDHNECKNRIRFVKNNKDPNDRANKLKGKKGMDKQLLRTALASCTAGDQLTVTFLGNKKGLTGEYTLVCTKPGRGKGGSLLAELRAATGETLVTGTPESDYILHVVTADGTLHGHETLSDVPPTFETDPNRAVTLKEQFKALAERCVPVVKEFDRDTRSRFRPDEGTPITVLLTSDAHEDYNGRFVLNQVELKRGRYGKVLLTVTPEGGSEPMLLDSFQHSGVLTSFEVAE